VEQLCGVLSNLAESDMGGRPPQAWLISHEQHLLARVGVGGPGLGGKMCRRGQAGLVGWVGRWVKALDRALAAATGTVICFKLSNRKTCRTAAMLYAKVHCSMAG
jgi:hypothetical protein